LGDRWKMTELTLDRYKLDIELYGVTFYYEIRFSLHGFAYVDTGTRDTPDQCFEAAMAYYAGKVREAA
jgi:hypothetical protein